MAIVPISRQKQFVDVCSSCGCPLFNASLWGPARKLCTACGSSARPASIAASVRKCKAATLLGSEYKPEHEDTSGKNDWKAAAAKRRAEQAGSARSIEKKMLVPHNYTAPYPAQDTRTLTSPTANTLCGILPAIRKNSSLFNAHSYPRVIHHTKRSQLFDRMTPASQMLK